MIESWHTTNIHTLFKLLNANDDSGLFETEAEARLEKYGFNELAKEEKRHPIFLFFEQFKDPLVIILLVALLISLIIAILLIKKLPLTALNLRARS